MYNYAINMEDNMLSKTSNMFQEQAIISIVNDLSSSIEYLDKLDLLLKEKNFSKNFQGRFLVDKESVEISVTDNDYLVIDTTNNGFQVGYTYEKKFSPQLQSEICYLRKKLQLWDEENERKRDRMGY